MSKMSAEQTEGMDLSSLQKDSQQQCHLNFHANLLRPWHFPLSTLRLGRVRNVKFTHHYLFIFLSACTVMTH